MYSEQVMDHFKNPRNLGDLPDETCRARSTNPICGDEAELAFEIRAGRIAAARFRAVGCVAALACCSCLTEMVSSRSVEEALEISPEQLMQELGGLPRSKRHAAALAVETLREALRPGKGTPE